MKANELRIGNWILWQNRPVQLKNAVELYNISTDEINSAPIPLTEEWLTKFGFDTIPYGCYIYRFNEYTEGEYFSLQWARLDQKVFICRNGRHPMPVNVQYVHQLQNLYFALTGQEL